MGGDNERDCDRAGRAGPLPTTHGGRLEPIADDPPLRHGGDLDAARLRYPDAPRPWIDLSTGINPRPYPVPALDTDAWARLPTATDLDALLAAAAARFCVSDRRRVVAAPGTQALIQVLPRLMPPCKVAVLGPTYDEHAASWRRQGHDVRIVRNLEAGARIVVVVNPNNPDGRLLPRAELAAFAQRLAATGGLLVVDEAFVDVLPDGASLAADLPPATIVLRSFGKTYGLAGLRLGFAVAHGEMAARLRAELGPWAVSGPAIDIGARTLADDDWLHATRTRLAIDASRMDELLGCAGFTLIGGTPLYRLAQHSDAARIADRLGRSGIHLRTFGHEPRWLRFGLPADEAAWQRLADALLRV